MLSCALAWITQLTCQSDQRKLRFFWFFLIVFFINENKLSIQKFYQLDFPYRDADECVNKLVTFQRARQTSRDKYEHSQSLRSR